MTALGTFPHRTQILHGEWRGHTNMLWATVPAELSLPVIPVGAPDMPVGKPPEDSSP